MPKVLHLGWSFSNHVTRWVYGLKERGWECRLVSYDGDPLPSIPTYIIKRKRFGKHFGKLGYLLAVPEMRQMVADFQPDIIHAHYAAGFGLWGALSGVRPFVVSGWGTDLVTTARATIAGAPVRWALQQADKILVTSEFLKDVVNELELSLRAPAQVIPFGIDIDALRKKTFSKRKDNRVRILFFKHHKAIYGPWELIRAFAAIADRFPNATLTMAGKGPLTDELQALATKLGIQHRVTFPGFIDNKHALSYIAGHDIMVMPSLVAEGFGVAALEALAVGIPVIAANSGAVSEIVDDNQSGLLINPANTDELSGALARLIADSDLRNRFGEYGKQQVAELYNWKENLTAMERVYHDLLKTKSM